MANLGLGSCPMSLEVLNGGVNGKLEVIVMTLAVPASDILHVFVNREVCSGLHVGHGTTEVRDRGRL
jgi:hypothetical protein